MKRGKKALPAAGEIYTEPDDKVFMDQFWHVFLRGIFPGLSQGSLLEVVSEFSILSSSHTVCCISLHFIPF